MGYHNRHILQEYWDRIHMVAQPGGYCGASFKVFWGVMKGDPFTPTIFNVVEEAVVLNWDLLVEEISGWQDRGGKEGRHHGEFFTRITTWSHQ